MDSSTKDLDDEIVNASALEEDDSSSNEDVGFSVDVDDLKDKYLRAQAEVENVRRRSQDELAKVRLFGAEKIVRSLLPICDSLEMALGVESQTLETLHSGVEMTHRQFQKLFSEMSISVIDPLNDKFDPNCHQAISTEVSDDVPPNHVLRVLQKGYRLHDRVVRAALVVVSKEKEE
ncbi:MULTISPECIES: nucleotide exchange factor GrpE [Candidatus Ichthyocystis]|uniref:Protein GrpE n=1 Tax=Candidatus Ichthyocystis hellenicum TaxID=1561003 RepID=A0A0S4M172_9BURK|nr:MULTISPECIES: nucleotide exchange factor GrpE [Ichthyocystis]CUT17527.1 putative molecular chaperone GrpE [Candidatus Ichthyocystis hellenicum]